MLRNFVRVISMNLRRDKYDTCVSCFGLVCFGLVGFSLNASLESQPRARKRARLAEDALADNTFWTGGNISSKG